MSRFLAGLAACLLLSACASTPAALEWDARVIRGELANGLRYQLIPDHADAGRLDLRLTVHAGSVDEDDDQVGVAHLVEHLAFYSHGGHPEDVRARLQAAGFQQGSHYNAVTNHERTQYLLSPPAGGKQAELALQALATLAFAADYEAADLERERPIVIEEWRGGLGVAERMNGQRIAAQRVGSRYPAHRSIGNREAIEGAALERLKAYQQRWYKPNNMVLSVVGDFDPQILRAQIERAFGAAEAAALPDREHLELPLDDHLKVFRVQDSQSGSNQVVLLFRFHDPASRRQDELGVRERLIDRLTLAALKRQLRRQARPEGVTSLTAVKTQIGRRSEVFGVAAGLRGDAHEQGLSTLLRELERLRRHGLHPEDVEAARTEVRELAERMLAGSAEADFAAWVRKLNDATIAERPLLHPHAIARHTLAALQDIDGADLLARLRRWSGSPDRVLQLSAPGERPLVLPTEEEVLALDRRIAAEPLEPPAVPRAESAETPVEPPPAAQAGIIREERSFPEQRVEYWTLGNGDRLVWLRQPGEGGRIRLQVETAAGFADAEVPAWQAQFASQLAAQALPPFWSAAQQKAWQEAAGLRLSVDQQARRRVLVASAPPDRLGELLALYRVRQTLVELDPDGLDEARGEFGEALRRRVDSRRAEQDRVWQRLKTGRAEDRLPTAEALDALTAERVRELWQRQLGAPATYYLMADVEPERLRELVRRELAGIPRGTVPRMKADERLAGRREASLAGALEPRTSLQAVSFAEQPWTPEDAVHVAMLRELAREALKARLRGEAAGVYRLDFDAELSPDEQRILSELRFVSAPQRFEELWALAQETLAELPASLDESRLAPLRERLRRQEAERLRDPATQFHRLVLSDRAWGDPRYLARQAHLADALQLAPMRTLAQRLFSADNRAVLKVLPQAAQ
ncbi:insulinase family protein [Pseudothauera nasutitermitis]|uniref:Insulinase family protein n=1 Tax=Pseudothauera nasutitermitis TaxID=2565930 RepID=A0A4S4B4Q1_9RHOO|nr:insulinase family protein [Pseudothauera nasutitermitis]